MAEAHLGRADALCHSQSCQPTRTSTQIVVTDVEGTVTGALDDLPGPTWMALDPSGRRLYVALPSADAIAVFDTRTLVERTRYDTGAGTCPGSLAVSGTRLWFGYGCAAGTGDIGLIDLARRPAPVRRGLLGGSPASTQPLLAVAAHRPDLLIAATDTLTSYTVGRRGSLEVLSTGESGTVLTCPPAVSADGSTVYAVRWTSGDARAYRTDDLATVVQYYYTSMERGAGIAISPDGQYLAVAAQMMSVAITVSVMSVSDAAVIDWGSASPSLQGRLVWSPDGTRLYAVTRYNTAVPPAATLRVLVLVPVLP